MRLNRLRPAFAGSDSDAVVHRKNKNLAVADLASIARATSFDNRVERRFDEIVVDRNLQLHFSQQVDGELSASIDLGLALLAAEALDVHNREPHDFDFGEGRLDVFQLTGLDNGDDELHRGVGRKSLGVSVWKVADHDGSSFLNPNPLPAAAESQIGKVSQIREILTPYSPIFLPLTTYYQRLTPKKDTPAWTGIGGKPAQAVGASFWMDGKRVPTS